MSEENTNKKYKWLLAIPIIIALAVIINITLDDQNDGSFTDIQAINPQQTSTSINENKDTFSVNNLYSGPFAILDGEYNVDDTVFLIGSEIPLTSKGEIIVIRPDEEIHHKFPFDGSESAVNHYFTPVSSKDLKECSSCKFFGVWKISFMSFEGVTYSPIYFEVEQNSKK